MKIRVMALLIVFSLFVSAAFAACGEVSENEDSGGSKKPGDEGSQLSETSKDESLPPPEPSEYTALDRRFNDTVTIFGKKDGLHVYSRLQWEYDEETVGDAINDAVNDRNQWLFDHYGIQIKYIASGHEDYFINAAVENMILSGGDDYDVVCDGLTTMAILAGGGYLYSLNGLSEYLDLGHSWWDQRVGDALSINHEIYYAAGDILITDDEYTYCLLYNKDLMEQNLIYADYEGRNLYQLVGDGDWTYETMFAIAKKCVALTSGSPTMTLEDTWGYVGDIGCLQLMMAAGGYQMAEKDNNDLPALNVVTTRSVDLFDRLVGYMNDATYSKFTERFGVDGFYGVAERMFAGGQIAFYNVKLAALTTLLNADASATIGVLPMPKASAEQDSYYNAAAPLHFSCVGIPISVPEDRLDTVCAAMEALGYLGQQSLTRAYIETTLKTKRADKSEDSDMIDLILKTRCFDLALAYDWGKLNSFFNQFAGSANTAFVSSWEKIEPTAMSDMEKTIDFFKNQE